MELVKVIPLKFYQEESGREPVRRWLHDLSREDRIIIGRDIRVVQADWPISSQIVKSLGNGIWEIRSRLDNRIARTLFIFHQNTIILLHGFIKKTQKTPANEIELAKKRARKIMDYHEKK